MYIESEDRIERPVQEIYELVRDELPKLLPYLPDVESIERVSYERESESQVRVVNRWRAKAAIPSMAKKFLPENLLEWEDRALWKDDEHVVEYHLTGFGYDVEGKNFFTGDGEQTILKVTATVTVHPEKFKIPRLVFKKVFPMIEGLLKKGVQPNLTALAKGLRAYFAQG